MKTKNKFQGPVLSINRHYLLGESDWKFVNSEPVAHTNALLADSLV